MVENDEGILPKKSVFKRVRRILVIFFSFFLLFISSLSCLLYFYQDEVKSAIISELNKYLKAEVRIDPKNIDLTILKTFPHCSIQFKNVLILEALQKKNKDTLLFAGQMNLLFNIRDLWNEKYDIQKLWIQNGVVKPITFANGKNNFSVWENKKPVKKEKGLNFDMDLITIEKFRLKYRDQKTAFLADINIERLDLKGSFNESSYTLNSQAKLFINRLSQEHKSLLKNKNCDYSIAMDVHENTYTVKQAEISLNRFELGLSGNFKYKDSLQNITMQFHAADPDIGSVLSLLPEKYRDNINDYESAGKFYANGKIRYKSANSYSLTSHFGVSKGTIIYKPKTSKADQVNIEGHLNMTNSVSSLVLNNISFQLGKDKLDGNCTIDDFSNPYINLVANTSLDLENLHNFWPIDTIDKLKGNLQMSCTAKGHWSDFKKQTFSDKVNLNMDVSLTGLEAQFKGDEKLYNIESFSLSAKDREVEVHDLKLKRGSSDIKLNGKIPGFFNYLADRTAPLIIVGNFYSDYLKLEDFIDNKSSSSGKSIGPLIPEGIDLKLNAAVMKLGLGKFEASAITGEIEIKNQKAVASDIKLQTMQGDAEINLFADNSKNKLEVVLESELKNIDVTELFYQMNNFGQTTLQDKNIKGSVSAKIEFSGSWNNQLQPDYKSIHSNCNLNIQRGELIDFVPLLKLSKYLDIEDLKRIRFQTLEGNISIRNSLITIPKTTVKNSALNIEVSGTHSFDNKIDYHLRLLISELLAKKRKAKDEEFGPVENDLENRRSAFILMTGTVDNPIIKYDRKGLKEKIKDDMKQEKENLGKILKNEFVQFKKEPSSKSKSDEEVFELEKPIKKPLEAKKKKDEDEDF